MIPLKNRSRKTLVAIALAVWFLPACFLLFQLAKNGTGVGQRILILPLMYGFTLTMWLRTLLENRHWFFWIFSVLISLGLPTLLVFLVLRTSRLRPGVLVAGFLLSCALTAAAYCLLMA